MATEPRIGKLPGVHLMSFFVFPCPLDVRHHLEGAYLMSATVFLSPVVNLRVHLMSAYLVFFSTQARSMSATVVAGGLDVHLHLFGFFVVCR